MFPNPQPKPRGTGRVLGAFGILASLSQPCGAQQVRSRDVTEVVFVAANPNLSFLHPGFSPAHIRGLLTKMDLTALCLVQLGADWIQTEGIPTYPQEHYAALTWALRRNVPVYGVSWASSARDTLPPLRMSDTSSLLRPGNRFNEFREARRVADLWDAAQAFGEDPNDLESWQRRELPMQVLEWPYEDSTAVQRGDRIADNIRTVVGKYVGQRIAILSSTAWYLPLKRRLESSGLVRVVPALAFFPLEPDRIAAEQYPDDAVLLLGTNLDDWRTLALPQSRNHQRTKELLDRLRLERPGSPITRYYEARWKMLLGDFDGARILLQTIARADTATRLPYVADPRWSWPPFRTYEQKARFYLAVAHDVAGQRDAAVVEYRHLLSLPADQLVVPAFTGARRIDLRPYLETFLRTPFAGGLFEGYRAVLAMGR